MQKKLRILKIMNDWSTSPEREALNSFGGCGYYRTLKVAQQLSPEHEMTVWNREWKDESAKYGNTTYGNEQFYSKIAKDYDMIWLHFTDNPTVFAWLRVACTKYGTKLVMDIDDNFLEVDKGNPALKAQNRGKLNTSNKVAMLATILSECDAITVSTLPLKKKIEDHILKVQKKKAKVFVVPNANDVNDWKFPIAEKNKVIIGYCGGLSHNDDLDMVLPSLKTVLEKYPDVSLQIIGQMDIKKAKKVFGKWEQSVRSRVFLMNATKTQPEYTKYLLEQPWSIGIAPLISSPFNESKSHIKWMEYAMAKIPTVASKVYPYHKDILGNSTIEDMETGILCEDTEWVDKLSMLIENKELRERLGENAYKFVEDNWQYKDQKSHILEVVSKI